jgi:hypothetical protein
MTATVDRPESVRPRRANSTKQGTQRSQPDAHVPVRPRRRWPLVAVLAMALTATVATALYFTSNHRSLRIVPGPSTLFSVPTAYHIVYRVTTDGEVSTEAVWVDRPFESVDVDLAGSPPGDSSYLTMVYRLGAQVTGAGGAQALDLRVPAEATPADVRPDAIVQAGLRAGLLKMMGHDRFAGRDCTVYRSAAPLRSGPLAAVRSASTYADTCIDSAGLVLREADVKAGHISSERVAVSVAVGAGSVSGAEFGLSGPKTPVDQGGGAFAPLTLTSWPPGTNWTVGSLPPGFRELGHFAVIPPQPQAFGQIDTAEPNPVGLPGSVITEIDDVWVRGTDVIILQEGESLDGAKFAAPTGIEAVNLGALGSGQVQISGTGTTVTAEPTGGEHFLRLSATLDPSTVIQLARSIVRAPSGTLTTIPQGQQ